MSGAAITGLGLHGPFGSLEATWSALAQGRGGVRAYALKEAPGLGQVPAAPAAPIDLSGLLPDPKLQKYMGRATELAVAAAGRALADAGIRRGDALAESTALLATTDLISFDLGEVLPALFSALREGRGLDYAWLGANGFRGCHPLLPFKMLLNMPLGMVSIALGLTGENLINYPNAQQSAVCLQTALRGLRSGRFPRALVGASAHPLSLAPMTRAMRLGAVAEASKLADPASGEHRGLALADAGAFFVLEAAEEARRRGARVLARLRSVASSPPDTFASAEELEPALLELFSEAAPDWSPDVAIATGFQSRAEIDACSRALGRQWRGPPALLSFDGKLGCAGAAALMVALLLGSRLLANAQEPEAARVDDAALGAAPAAQDFAIVLPSAAAARPHSALVLSRDTEGALAAALLEASGEAGA